MKLIKDPEVARETGMSLSTLRSRRYKERGNILVGKPQDLVPKWVDMPGGKRSRVLGTPPEELDAWIRRNLV